MRNPERIDKTLGLIEKIWKANPDLRLMQLLLNLFTTSQYPMAYYIEEDELEHCLKIGYKVKDDKEK